MEENNGSHSGPASLSGRPVIFGEVLFDQFPDGSRVLGGAPFNVAWHLQGFGLRPLFVSRVGDDPLGDEVVAAMERWGMDTCHLQRDGMHPTGRVEVTLEKGQPSYVILPDQAYDFIEPPALDGHDCSLFYHGTLIERSPVSGEALQHLRRRGLPPFLDVNLRAPWWERAAVMEGVRRACWVKLNDEELETLLQRPLGREEIPSAGERLREEAGLELLVVTLGADGAWIFTSEGSRFGEPVKVEALADTVGAGDAFSAVTLLGLHRGWPAPVMLERALDFAARICAQRGATRPDQALYDEYLCRWQDG